MGILGKSLLRFMPVLLLALFPLRGMSQTAEVDSDTLEIRFKLDSVMINMHFDGNMERWNQFERDFNQRFAGKNRLGIVVDIYSGASPEGTVEHNRWLGQERGESIKQLIEQRLRGRVGYIMVHNEAARWDGLYQLVAKSNEPWKDDVLRIISEPASVNETGRDRREWKLRNHKNSDVWEKMLSTYLPPLRSGGTAVVSWMPELITSPAEKDTVYVMYDTPPCITCPPDPFVVSDEVGDLYVKDDTVTVTKPVVRKPVWILRTNLPLLAIGTPNLQAEWSLDHKDRWSINIEGVWSWWTFAHNAYANQMMYGSVEIRRWLGRRWRHHSLDGWHIGLAAGVGYGDVEWKSRGYQGEVYSGFINIGWQKRFGRNKQWAFDAGIGLGYAYVPWRRYRGSSIFPEGKEERYDDHLMWRETSRTHWIGTPHLNISIGYVFPVKDAEWKRAKAVQRDIDRNAALHYRDSVLIQERYEQDSIRTSLRQRRNEISLLPEDERIAAYQQYYADKKQLKDDIKAAKQRVKDEKKAAKEQEKLEKQQLKEQLMQEREQARQERLAHEQWLKSPEGQAVADQEKAAAKAAKQQAKAAKKAAKQKAKLEKKQRRMQERIDAEQYSNRERLRRELEQTDYKYNGRIEN